MTDDEHEAFGAMIHAMKPRDHHREIADELEAIKTHLREAIEDRDAIAGHRDILHGEISHLRAEVERLTRERDTILKEVSEWRSRPDALRADKAEARAETAELQVATLREALEFYADDENWRREGKCDPNSGNFIGRIHARAALAETEKKDGD